MTEKRCKNCDAYNHKEKFCYKHWQNMDTLEYCSEFILRKDWWFR